MRASRAGTARDAAEAQRGQVNVSGLAIVQSRVPHAEAGGAAADNGGNGGDNDAALGSTSQLEEETAGYAIVTRGGRAVFVQCSVESEVSGCCFASASSTVELKGCHLKRAAAHGVLVSGKADVLLPLPHSGYRGGVRRGAWAIEDESPCLPRTPQPAKRPVRLGFGT